MAIVELPDVKDFLKISTGGDDAILERLIGVAQKEIENRCGTIFESSSATRSYKSDSLMDIPVGGQTQTLGSYARGPSSFSWDAAIYSSPNQFANSYRVLYLGRDLLTVTTLTNGDGNVISSTGYWLEPRNDPPYRQIRLRSSESWVFNTDGEITVAGTWGRTSSPPDDIVEAALELIAYRYRNRDNPVFDVTASPEIGVITVPKGFPITVERILERGGYLSKPYQKIV